MKKFVLTAMVMMMVGVIMAQVQKPSKEMSWKKRLKLANQYYEQNDYASAAAFYASVVEDKPKKIEVAFKAGEAFSKIRDFKSAADAYAKAIDGEFEKVGYKYANALKQSGSYNDAKAAFQKFINDYKGEDYEVMDAIVELEMKGCDLARELQNTPPKGNIEIEHLSRMVNSDMQEYGPIPFLDNLLYFSSYKEGTSQIYRSERTSAGWEKPAKPNIFGSMEKQHFGHGTFTPDRKAFYFTQCERDSKGEMICEIYVMQRKNTWLKPVKLPEYVNETGSSSTQPFVTVVDNKELLYFASNRKGGKGGYDLYFVTRDFGTSDFNYSLPVNLGDNVNTPKDEMTPFYDLTAKQLYFSSNGHPGVGGFDIFRISGDRSSWGETENLGLPTNSIADDYYYTLRTDKQVGYFVSNRLEGTSKTYTDNDDLFQFKKKEVEVVIRGNIFEKDNPNKKLDNVVVDLYEVIGEGQKTPLVTKVFDEGFYQFSLMPNKKYSITAERDGYLASFFEVSTTDFKNTAEYSQDIPLEPSSIASVPPGGNAETETDITSPPGGNYMGEEEEEEIVTPNGRIDPNTPPGSKETVNSTVTNDPPQPPVYAAEEVEETEPEPPVYQPETEEEVANNTTTTPSYTEEETITETTSYEEKPITNPYTTTTEVDTPPTQPETQGGGIGITETEEVEPETKRFSQLTREQVNSIFFLNDKAFIREDGILVEIPDYNPNYSTYEAPVEKPIEQPIASTTYEQPTKYDPIDSPSESGVNYKIQLVAVTTYKDYKFSGVRHLGSIQLEPTISKRGIDVNRVLLTSFSSHSEAKEVLREVRRNGFKKAQIIRYENGERMTTVR